MKKKKEITIEELLQKEKKPTNLIGIGIAILIWSFVILGLIAGIKYMLQYLF